MTCTLGVIPSGGQAQVQLTVRAETAAAGQTLNNTASVTANEPEARSADNRAGTNLGVTQPPSPGPAQRIEEEVLLRTPRHDHGYQQA